MTPPLTAERLIARVEELDKAAGDATWSAHHALKPGAELHPNQGRVPARVKATDHDHEGRRRTRFVAVCDSHGTDNNANADLIAEYRTLAPELARALASTREELERVQSDLAATRQALEEAREIARKHGECTCQFATVTVIGLGSGLDGPFKGQHQPTCELAIIASWPSPEGHLGRGTRGAR